MKKLNVVFLALILFFASIRSVYAVCDATESNTLNSLAVNVRASYEAIEEEYTPDESFNPPDGMPIDDDYVVTRNIFRIYITNITEELYVVVTNDVTDEELTFTYQDSNNGTVTFDQEDLSSIRNYTVTVYSSSQTNCPDTRLYNYYFTTPMYNTFSEYDVCEGLEEFYLCYEYLSVSMPSYADFLSSVEDYRNGLIDEEGEEIPPDVVEEDNSFWDYVGEHWIIITIVAGVIIVGGVLVTVIIVKKQRSKIV